MPTHNQKTIDEVLRRFEKMYSRFYSNGVVKKKEIRAFLSSAIKERDDFWEKHCKCGDCIERCEEARRKEYERLIKKIENTQELHTHNSIPSFTASIEEGCIICIKNEVLSKLLSYLNEQEKLSK